MVESPATPTTPLPGAQRIIPGAPPPSQPTKSQLKRRQKQAKGKTEGTDHDSAIPNAKASALVETAPAAESLPDELVARGNNATSQAPEKPASVAQDIIHKKLKVVNKKIQRIHVYSQKPKDTLNADQIKTLETLPSLEAVARELEELTKAVEAAEKEEWHETLTKRTEQEKAVAAQVAEAVNAANAKTRTKHHILLAFLALASLIAGSSTSPQHPSLTEDDHPAIREAAESLLAWPGDPSTAERKDAVLAGLLGENDADDSVAGVEYARLRTLATQYIHPPTPIPSPPPAAASSLPETEGADGSVASSQPESAGTVPPASGSFHFMQESELESGQQTNTAASINFGEAGTGGSEWVQVEPIRTGSASQVISGDVEKQVQNEHAALNNELANSTPEPPATSAPLDWAADEDDDLPPISTLQQKFGQSGSATPEMPNPPTPLNTGGLAPPSHGPMEERSPLSAVSQHTDSYSQGPGTPVVDEDGFVLQSRGHKHSHARGGFRGFSGDDRGRGRGGRGEGRGGFRGGRGRGGFQNGEGGHQQGGPNGGGWRGGRNPSVSGGPPAAEEEGWQSVGGTRNVSDSGFRGRGGRGRGGFEGGRGGSDGEGGHTGEFRGRRMHGGFRMNRGGPPPAAPASQNPS